MGSTTAAIPATGHPRRWLGLGFLSTALVMLAIDMTVLNVAVPAVTADLNPTGAEMLWMVDIYALAIAGLLITFGTLGDHIGRKRLLLSGLLAFAAASALCAFADHAQLLILGRAIQGIAGATLMPSTLSIIRTMFPDAAERARAVSIWIGTYGLGAAAGPVVGGWLLEHFHWGSVFLINVPIALIVFLGGLVTLPESRSHKPGAFDIAGAVLSIIAMLTFVGAIKVVISGNYFAAVGLAALCVIAALGFIIRMRTADNPLIDLRLFESTAYNSAVLINLLSSLLYVGLLFLLMQYLQVVIGKTPLEAGIMLVPAFVLGFLTTIVVGELLRFVSARPVLISALVVSGIGFAGLAANVQGLLSLSATLTAVGGCTLMSMSAGAMDPVTNNIILNAAPPEHAGAASAISETGYELGGALGTAVLGSIMVGVYSHGIRALTPSDYGLTESQLTHAADSISAAHNVAKPINPDFIAAADLAFDTGMAAALWAGAALCAAATVAAWVSLPRTTT
ncbi:MFS transporter [Corynebacterium ulceribovis]|uniref:MFS transporter n=1 Tax=Corynebacterium ulceribovis TaxID=487732 RepID=UPI00037D4A39|nr:MFS transporter [Corynebacterium ulceribovis]